jgi:CxxC-x17-CxxC domain-containing protein
MEYNKDISYFAQTNFRSQNRGFGIKLDDRRRHMYVIGKTGMGKSEMLKNMAIQDINNGNGLAIVDPHGELVEDLLNAVPQSRVNDVVYFNPADGDYPLAFNILESVDDPHQKNLVASGLIGIFKKLWADSWGPRLEYLLRNAILALLDYPGATLLGVTRILVDKEYRKKVVLKIKDPVVKSFWTQEYPKYNQQFQVEAISPIQNKVGQFLSLSLIRNIVGQVKSTIDLRKIMDEKKILLLNLSKGRIGEDASALLGAMMITKIQMAAMGRVDIPEAERQDFYLYVDEFQNFVTNSFADILSEARKYRLNLIIAHQYIGQLITSDSTRVRDAVFGNVGTLVTFRVGADDAEFLAKEFVPTFDETDLVNLGKYDIYLKLMIDGIASIPFSATTLPPLPKEQTNIEKIIKVSRERYATPREIIEDKIARWAGFEEGESGEEEINKPDKYSRDKKDFTSSKKTLFVPKNDEETMFPAQCSNCHKDINVKFKPDGVRPVFCPDCLKLYKQKKINLPQIKNQSASQENSKSEKLHQLSEAKTINIKPVIKKQIVIEDVVNETPAEISLTEALGKLHVSTKSVPDEKITIINPDKDDKSEDELKNKFMKSGTTIKFS